jgi:hypothetical protein
MNHLMKKTIVGLVAAASVATIAYADSGTPAKPELVDIDVTVTKDLGESVELLSKVSMKTDKARPAIASNRRTITYRKAIARSNNDKYNYDSKSETSVGVDAAYIPAASSTSDKPELEYTLVLVSIDDLINLEKFRLTDAKDEFIELPQINSARIAVPVDPGRTNIVKRGDYTVTVTERTVTD